MIAIIIVCFLVIASRIACVWWIDRMEHRARVDTYVQGWPIGPTPEELAEIEASEHPRETDSGC